MPLVSDSLTPLDHLSLRDALRQACPGVSPAGRLILLAHIALETGLRACHRWNLGNAKASGAWGGDYCQFPCGEEVTAKQAAEQARLHPGLVEFVGRPYQRDGVTMQSVRVLPPHPWTSFRAYPTLLDGVDGYLAVLRLPRYSVAWGAMAAGDLRRYVAELKRAGYMTAGEGGYLAGVTREWHRARGVLLGRPTLRQGDSEEGATREWQRVIGVSADGKWGPATERATREWQEGHGLVADGVVGPVSWSVALPGAVVES